MATIIKIKNSNSVGNVPSSLERGEFAINTRDGNLFYGDGTYVQQNFVFNDLGLKGNLTVDGNITAQQYIVSSSVTYMTQSFLSGSTIFGDSADDTHQFTGSLLVNGNSTLDGNFTVEGITYLNNNIYLGDSSSDRIYLNGVIETRIKTNSHITASGNISSSGTIYANEYIGLPSGLISGSTQISGLGFVDKTGTPSNNNIAVFTDSNTIEGDNNLYWDGTSFTLVAGDLAQFNTATSIIFNNANDDLIFQVKGSTDDNLLQVNPQYNDRIGIGTNTPGEKLEVIGNISASGDITANNATITTQLTAAGINYPTTDGDNGDTIFTDGAGNLSFGRTTIYANVKNVHGSTLAKGMPVHATGTAGNASEVVAASASNAATMPATYVLAQELDDQEEGLAIVTGYINGVDTSLFGEGDVIYVGADGGYTNSKPTGSNLIQNLGIVAKSAANGSGYVYGSGRSNDVPNITPGYAWVGNSDSVATAVATSSFVVDTASLANEVAFTNITGKPTLISSSAQIDHDSTTNFSADEHFTQANITTVGTVTSGDVSAILPAGTISSSAQVTITESQISDLDHYTDSDVKTKLNTENVVSGSASSVRTFLNVEDGADVTDTANVTAAGALMDSEVTSLSLIKGLTAAQISGAFDSVSASLASDIPTNNNQLTNGAGYTTNTGTVDTTGTPANNQLAIFTDSDTIEGDSNLTFDGSKLTLTSAGGIDISGPSVLDQINVTEGVLSSAGDFGVGSRVFTKLGTLTATTAGTLYYLDGSWAQADADAASSATNLIAVAVTTSSNNGMLCQGIIKMSTNTGFSGASVGDPLYISNTAGEVTSTAPSGTTGYIVRVVGYVVDATDGVIYFNPSNDWIELA